MLCFMAADGFHYQVDFIGGDGNARFGDNNQQESSNEDSLFQQVLKSFRDAFIPFQNKRFNISPKLRFT